MVDHGSQGDDRHDGVFPGEYRLDRITGRDEIGPGIQGREVRPERPEKPVLGLRVSLPRFPVVDEVGHDIEKRKSNDEPSCAIQKILPFLQSERFLFEAG